MAGAGGKRSQAHNAFSGRANTIPAPVADQRAARAAGRAAPIAGPAAAGTGPKPAISFGSIPPFFQMMRNPYRALPCFLLTGLLLANFSKPAAAQPTITAVTPAANARAAAPAGPVTVGFSQPLLPSSAAALFVYSGQRGGLRSRGTTPAVVSGAELRFSPGPGGFAAGETVSTTIGAGVASSTGHLAAPRVVQFTTAAGGTGQGNFQPGADVGMGIHPLALAVGDIDGDGDPDLLTVSDYSYYSGVINIRLNDGTGSFGSPQSLPPTRAMQGLTLGDVDADGDLDLLTANYVEGSVSIRRNNGSGTFGPSQEVAVGQGVVQIVLADIDADGDLDLLALTYLNSGVSVRLNDGTGTFSGYDAVPVERYPVRMAVGDLDADGDLDLVTANSDSLFNTASVRLNNGQGSFAASQELRLGTSPSSVALGDIDGDGDLDLLVTTRTSDVAVFLNGGDATGSNTGVFAPSPGPRILTFGGPVSIAVGDVDGDGDLDLLTADYFGYGVSVRLNGGDATGSNTGFFSRGSQVLVGFSPVCVTLGDVDGDGDLDLLSTSPGQGGSVVGNVSVRLNGGDASGSNTGAFSDGSTVPVGDTPRSVALGDVDGDGDLDLFTANSGDNTLSVRLNGGDATGSNTGLFSNGSEVPVGDEPRSVQAADVDADGDLDLLTVNRLGNTVSIRLNDGHGIFSGTREVAVGAQPRELALGDVDGDGDVDFVTANFGGSSASVRLNAATALASRAAAAAAPGLLLLPNPARGMVRATHLPAHQPVQVFDALGRLVLSATADAAGTATLNLPPGLPAGIYLVRGGGMAARLAVE
jgi:hypothetical protein